MRLCDPGRADFVICIEMLLFAVVHHRLFPASDYVARAGAEGARVSAARATADALPGLDLLRDAHKVRAPSVPRVDADQCTRAIQYTIALFVRLPRTAPPPPVLPRTLARSRRRGLPLAQTVRAVMAAQSITAQRSASGASCELRPPSKAGTDAPPRAASVASSGGARRSATDGRSAVGAGASPPARRSGGAASAPRVVHVMPRAPREASTAAPGSRGPTPV